MTVTARPLWSLSGCAALLGALGCASSTAMSGGAPSPRVAVAGGASATDPRVGLRAGLWDAQEVAWNLRVLSETPPSEAFVGVTNSDLAFVGPYAIQGNYNGIQIWDISNPGRPQLVDGYVCPASQSDVSVVKNLLFVSGEGLGGRLDCGTEGVEEVVSHERLRGIRIFDISNIRAPRYVANVQTCRGSHTHSVLEDPNDPENVYIYVSGSASVRPAEELPGCTGAMPDEDPNTALFRIEVIKVPLAHPEQAAIVSSPRIFQDLAAPPEHGQSAADIAAVESAMLDSVVKARGGVTTTAADSQAVRAARRAGAKRTDDGPRTGPTQCHDITLYPAIGLAGGACAGYGLLLDISDPANPVRIGAVSDSNFSYWHSATFNNDGTKLLFSDEWGGGGQPKCRVGDPMEWGADALFTIENRRMRFQSYYKMPAAQTAQENCVAHNGSLIPIPGRDVMVQAWYQGGISVFDWTDAAHPKEIAFFDRGPVDASQMRMGGSWSAYWYNGVIVSSEIARGLDIFELAPSPFLTENEIEAAKSVKVDHYNTQGQPRFVWPATFALARAYLDQLERSGGLAPSVVASARQRLASAERASGPTRRETLTALVRQLGGEAAASRAAVKVRQLGDVVTDLAGAMR